MYCIHRAPSLTQLRSLKHSSCCPSQAMAKRFGKTGTKEQSMQVAGKVPVITIAGWRAWRSSARTTFAPKAKREHCSATSRHWLQSVMSFGAMGIATKNPTRPQGSRVPVQWREEPAHGASPAVTGEWVFARHGARRASHQEWGHLVAIAAGATGRPRKHLPLLDGMFARGL